MAQWEKEGRWESGTDKKSVDRAGNGEGMNVTSLKKK